MYDNPEYRGRKTLTLPISSFGNIVITGTNKTGTAAATDVRHRFFKKVKLVGMQVRVDATPPDALAGVTGDHTVQLHVTTQDGTSLAAATLGTVAHTIHTAAVTPVIIPAGTSIDLRASVTFDGTLATITPGNQVVFLEYQERL
jgi:hypothetical protein